MVGAGAQRRERNQMTGSAQLPRRCWVEIDLAALERNLKLIRRSLPPGIKYVAVVKADAYGHGLHQVAARLMHAGADLLAVASLAEALALRELSADCPILLLSPVLPDEDGYLAEHDLAATVSSAQEVARFGAVGDAAGKPVRVHLKIDTGMGRLGVWHEHARPVFEQIRHTPGIRLAGVFTHFSSADEDPAFTAEQRQRFLAALAGFRGFDPAGLFIHADNSAGLESASGEGPFNAVRVGLLQFGVLPHPHSMLARVRTEPVFSFHTRVGLVKRLPTGTGISYGRTFILTRPSTIAVLTAGYGDGFARACSNRASVLIRGRRCPVLGRVTMDQIIVDLTDLDAAVEAGEVAVLVGRQGEAEITVMEFSRWSDSIPWETLCSVTKRVPRLYRTPLGI
jgi:alanine racemase